MFEEEEYAGECVRHSTLITLFSEDINRINHAITDITMGCAHLTGDKQICPDCFRYVAFLKSSVAFIEQLLPRLTAGYEFEDMRTEMMDDIFFEAEESDRQASIEYDQALAYELRDVARESH